MASLSFVSGFVVGGFRVRSCEMKSLRRRMDVQRGCGKGGKRCVVRMESGELGRKGDDLFDFGDEGDGAEEETEEDLFSGEDTLSFELRGEDREDDEKDNEGEEEEEEEEDDDVWRRLLDGMRDRIVANMKVEMNSSVPPDGKGEEEEFIIGRKEMGMSTGKGRLGERKSSSYSKADETTEGSFSGKDGEEGDEEDEDMDVFSDNSEKWERALEEKLRQLVGSDGSDDSNAEDAEIEGEEYFSLSESEMDFNSGVDGDNTPDNNGNATSGFDSLQVPDLRDEFDEPLEKLDDVDDVHRLVGRVYDRIISRRNADTNGSSERSSSKDDSSSGATPPKAPQKPTKTNRIYEKIRVHIPGDISRLTRSVSPDALKAMKRSLSAILGSLPEQMFELTFRSDRDGLGQLLFAAEVTGYFLRDGEIKHAFSSAESSELDEEHERDRSLPDAAWPLKKDFTGKLSWWDPTKNEKTDVHPATYVQRLEAEVDSLRQQYEAFKANGGTEVSSRLLEYASLAQKGPGAPKLSDISEEATDAMQRMVNSLLGRSGSQIQQSFTTEREYLSQLILWCLMIGYIAKDVENRLQLSRILGGEDAADTGVDDDNNHLD